MFQARTREASSERGFTLIELLVVIIILGILAAVVVFAVNGVGDKGKSAATNIDERTIRTAEEAYCARFSTYASGQQLIDGGFLSDLPEYHEVNAQQTASPGQGNCNGWKYFVTRTDKAEPHGAGGWSFVAGPPGIADALVRLADGRVFGRYNAPGPNAVQIWNPVTNTWSTEDPSPDTATSDDPAGAPDMLLVEDPATTYSECKGVVDNCGKVLTFGHYLFDPSVAPGTTGQWQTLSPTGCNVCYEGNSRGNFSYVQIKGSPAQCGVNCGKIAFFTAPGADAIAGSGVAPNSYDLFDPRTNTYESYVYPTAGFSPSLGAQEVLNIFVSGAAQLPDGRIFACCEADGFTPRSAFMDITTNPPVITEGPVPPGQYTRSNTESAPLAVLPNGDVLLAGLAINANPQSTAIYTPTAGGPGSFATVPHCVIDTRCLRVASLSDGRVLARRDVVSNGSPEMYLFNPATRSWSRAADLNDPFSLYHDAVYLDPAGGPCGDYCGKVLGALLTAEVYTP